MNENSFESIQLRIDILYEASASFVQREAVAPIAFDEEQYTDDEGREMSRLSFGGGDISQKETIKAMHNFSDIVSRLANLKDPLKNVIHNKNGNNKLVEECIDSSDMLSIVIDMNNAEKHGYPVKKHPRSGLDPRIENIRKVMLVPIKGGGRITNAFMEGFVVFEADIVGLDGEFICSFRDVVERSIRDWEDFILENLPSESSAISNRRDKELEIENWYKGLEKQRQEVESLVNDENNWCFLKGMKASLGMFVRLRSLEQNVATIMGPVSEPNDRWESESSFPVFDVISGMPNRISKDNDRVEVFAVKTKQQLRMVNNFYWNLYHPIDET